MIKTKQRVFRDLRELNLNALNDLNEFSVPCVQACVPSSSWWSSRDLETYSVGRCSLSSGKGHHIINVAMVAKTPKAKPAPKKSKPNVNLAPKDGDHALKKTKGSYSVLLTTKLFIQIASTYTYTQFSGEGTATFKQ